jgi:hypothetical protein
MSVFPHLEPQFVAVVFILLLSSLLGLILSIAHEIAEVGATGEEDTKPNGAFLRSGKTLISLKVCQPTTFLRTNSLHATK